MEPEITKSEWQEFVDIVIDKVNNHPETGFLSSLARGLDSDILRKYQVIYFLKGTMF